MTIIRKKITLPRIVISSIKGKTGKTLVTVSLLKALSKEGYKVSAFKNGPDFIDPTYHKAVTGQYSRNLDFFLMGDTVTKLFYQQSKGSDIALIEGNHGLYDSIDGISETGSTAQLAKLLGAPVLLVIDGERINRTAGAILRGLVQFDHKVKIIGVVLTNIIPRQYNKMREVIEEEGVPVIGVIYRNRDITDIFHYRHLGLQPVTEMGPSYDFQTTLNKLPPESFQTNRIMKLAKSESEDIDVWVEGSEKKSKAKPNLKFGIMGGKSFTFYYPETIEKASLYGTVRFINPEEDNELPNLDVLIIGGGFPEVYAQHLEKNKSFRNSVWSFGDNGGIIYAECGGLIYLTDSVTFKGEEHDLVGLINGRTQMNDQPVAHGYSIARVLKDNLISHKGDTLKGHEFHYSKISLKEKYEFNLSHEKGTGIEGKFDGIQVKNTFAQYAHLHPAVHDFVKAISQKFATKETLEK